MACEGVGGAIVKGGDVHVKTDGGIPTSHVPGLSGSLRSKGREEWARKGILAGEIIQKRPKKTRFGREGRPARMA